MVQQRGLCGCFGGCIPVFLDVDQESELASKRTPVTETQHLTINSTLVLETKLERPGDLQGPGLQLLEDNRVEQRRWGLRCPCRARASSSSTKTSRAQDMETRRVLRASIPFDATNAQSAALVAEWKIVSMALGAEELDKLHDLFNLVEKLGLMQHPAHTLERPHARQAATLVRFLRARDGDVRKAASLLKEALDWRHEFELDRKLTEWKEEMDAGTSARARVIRKYGYVQQIGLDLVGHPVFVQRFSQGDPGGLVRELGEDALLLYLISVIEDSFVVQHQQMLQRGRFVNGFIEVVDVGNYGIVGGWYQRALAAVGPYSKFAPVFDKVYPERLRAAFILRAPKAFALIWRLILPLIPAATRTKVRIKGQAASSWMQEILEFLPRETVPIWLQEDNPLNYPGAIPAGGFVPIGVLRQIENCN